MNTKNDDQSHNDPEEGSSSSETGSSTEGTSSSSSGSAGKTLTESEVDGLLGKARNTAARDAQKRLLADLGFESADSMREFVEAKRKADLEAMDEADRIKAEAARERAEAETAKQEAREATTRARIAESLVTGPDAINPERVRIATDNALIQALRAPDDEEDPIAYGIQYVRDNSPEWFTASSSNGEGSSSSSSGTKGTGTPPPPGRESGNGGKPPSSGKSGVLERFEKHKNRNKAPADILTRLSE